MTCKGKGLNDAPYELPYRFTYNKNGGASPSSMMSSGIAGLHQFEVND